MADIREYDPLRVKEEFVQALSETPVYASRMAMFYHPSVETRIFKEVFRSEQFYDDDGGFYTLNMPPKVDKVLSKNFVYQKTNLFDEEWYTNSNQYIRDLSPRRKYIVARYTRHGDEIVNLYLRDPVAFRTDTRIRELLFDTMPNEQKILYAMQLIDQYDAGNEREYITMEGDAKPAEYREIQVMLNTFLEGASETERYDRVIPLIEEYIEELRNILSRAPKINKPIRVFRAAKTDYINETFSTQKLKGFLSTSLDNWVTETFKDNNFIYQITLQPGTRCISIKDVSQYYNEFEVLVDADAVAVASDVMEKHNLQTYFEEVNPYHILSSPMNPVRKVRHVQVICEPRHTGGRMTKMTKKVKSARAVHTIHSQKVVSRRSPRKTRTKTRKTRTRKTQTKDMKERRIWTEPLAVPYNAPPALKKFLLEQLNATLPEEMQRPISSPKK